MWGEEQCVRICASLPLLQYLHPFPSRACLTWPLLVELDPSSWGHLAFFCHCVGYQSCSVWLGGCNVCAHLPGLGRDSQRLWASLWCCVLSLLP